MREIRELFLAGFLTGADVYRAYWPYCEPDFYPEVDYTEDDNAVLGDDTRFVPRRPPALCNRVHFVLTGKNLDTPGIWHAKDWVGLLMKNGYNHFYCPPQLHYDGTLNRTIEKFHLDPSDKVPFYTDSYYIGVSDKIGEYGEVVWFEDYPGNRSTLRDSDIVRVSTCREFRAITTVVEIKDYIWMQIGDYRRAI